MTGFPTSSPTWYTIWVLPIPGFPHKNTAGGLSIFAIRRSFSLSCFGVTVNFSSNLSPSPYPAFALLRIPRPPRNNQRQTPEDPGGKNLRAPDAQKGTRPCETKFARKRVAQESPHSSTTAVLANPSTTTEPTGPFGHGSSVSRIVVNTGTPAVVAPAGTVTVRTYPYPRFLIILPEHFRSSLKRCMVKDENFPSDGRAVVEPAGFPVQRMGHSKVQPHRRLPREDHIAPLSSKFPRLFQVLG